MAELQRILTVNGKLYVAVPVGIESIYFNAHRVFNPQTIIDAFPKLRLTDFSVVDTRVPQMPQYHEHITPDGFKNEICDNGALIGLFEFEK